MTGQLSAQRTELMEAYRQIDNRRHFTETVLSGVSAGVIGLDVRGRIELPNRAADELLGSISRPSQAVRWPFAPEFAPLVDAACGPRSIPRPANCKSAPWGTGALCSRVSAPRCTAIGPPASS